MFQEPSEDFKVIVMAHEWYSSYDIIVPKICPDYNLGLDSIVDSIPSSTKSILELGNGTGNLTLRLAQRFPEAKVVGIDADAKMLESAKQKTSGYRNVNLVRGEFPFINFGRFDAVVSSLLFHLLPENDRRDILEKIYKSGTNHIAIFDRIKGETQEQEDGFFDYFVRQLIGKGLPTGIVFNLINESVGNNPIKLSEHVAICDANGFKFNILYQNPAHGFVAYSSTKQVGNFK